MIIDHNNKAYRKKWQGIGDNRYNGAFFYSKEIVKYIIPNVTTDRNWITVNMRGVGCDHAVVFVHNNLHPENYDWMERYEDLILVCGVPETVSKVKHLGKAIYLPLSVNVADIERYRTDKSKDRAYIGRRSKANGILFPPGTDFISGLPRTRFLREIAKYREVYAVGRAAIEAKILGCEILPYDPRYPDPSIWEIIDNSEAAKMLQVQLDLLDRGF